MLKLPTFHCATHGRFEELIRVDVRDPEAMAAARSHACPKCGELAPQIIEAPRVQTTVSAVEMGGRLYLRDQIEESLASAPDRQPQFWEKPDFEGDFLEKLDRKIAQHYAGELPPPPEPTAAEVTQIQNAITKE